MRKVLHGKEMNRTSRCENTIFSKYLTLPMATFPHIYLYIYILYISVTISN